MSKTFNQATFDAEHAEPREYGEGDHYVVGGNFSDEQAATMIGEWETDLTGDEHTYTADEVGDVKMYVGKNEDGEDDWVLNNYDEAEPVAWGKGISL